MGEALRIDGLHKSFTSGFIPKTKKILKGISLTVQTGEIFGYLGPNGAGKTTTIKCILNLIFPDEGRIEILEQNNSSPSSRDRIGFLPENPYFYDYLTATEFMDFYGQLVMADKETRREKTRSLLRLMGLEKSANIQLRKFSRGMLQRVGLAQALLNDPSLLLLDEPLGGLDPLGRKEIRDVIIQLREEGKTVFLSSHILQDIEMICDRVAILVEGQILNQGPLQDLISENILFTELVLSGMKETEFKDLGVSVSTSGGKILLKVLEEEKLDKILKYIQSKNGKIHSLVPRTQTLEDLFVGLVKKT